MFSPDFLKRFREITAQKANAVAVSNSAPSANNAGSQTEVRKKSIGTRPSAYANARQKQVEGVVYDPITGKAFPNASTAMSEGVQNYSSQLPSGIQVDWSYWNKFKQPEVAEVEVQELEVADQTIASPTPEPASQPSTQPASQPASQYTQQSMSSPAPPPSPAKPKSMGPQKSQEQWTARAKQLGWSPDQYSGAAYQGYANKFPESKRVNATPAPPLNEQRNLSNRGTRGQ